MVCSTYKKVPTWVINKFNQTYARTVKFFLDYCKIVHSISPEQVFKVLADRIRYENYKKMVKLLYLFFYKVTLKRLNAFKLSGYAAIACIKDLEQVRSHYFPQTFCPRLLQMARTIKPILHERWGWEEEEYSMFVKYNKRADRY